MIKDGDDDDVFVLYCCLLLELLNELWHCVVQIGDVTDIRDLEDGGLRVLMHHPHHQSQSYKCARRHKAHLVNRDD